MKWHRCRALCVDCDRSYEGLKLQTEKTSVMPSVQVWTKNTHDQTYERAPCSVSTVCKNAACRRLRFQLKLLLLPRSPPGSLLLLLIMLFTYTKYPGGTTPWTGWHRLCSYRFLSDGKQLVNSLMLSRLCDIVQWTDKCILCSYSTMSQWSTARLFRTKQPFLQALHRPHTVFPSFPRRCPLRSKMCRLSELRRSVAAWGHTAQLPWIPYPVLDLIVRVKIHEDLMGISGLHNVHFHSYTWQSSSRQNFANHICLWNIHPTDALSVEWMSLVATAAELKGNCAEQEPERVLFCTSLQNWSRQVCLTGSSEAWWTGSVRHSTPVLNSFIISGCCTSYFLCRASYFLDVAKIHPNNYRSCPSFPHLPSLILPAQKYQPVMNQ